MYSIILDERAANSSLDFGLEEMRESSSVEDDPPRAADPSNAAALSKSAFNSFSLSLRAFSLGSRTSSESESPSLSCAALLAASFSAIFALMLPFFLGGATGAATGFSSSEDDSSQLSYMQDRRDERL